MLNAKKNLKLNVLAGIISCIIFFSFIVANTATPKINIDGTFLSISKETGVPYVENGVTLVPLRVISENLGYKVDWSTSTKKITITNGTKTVVLTVGSKTATIDGKAVTLLKAPEVKNNRTYVPLRFIGETFGCDVVWESPVVYISTKGKVIIPKPDAKPITDVLKPNSNLNLLIDTKGDENGQIIVTESTLDKGINLSTPVVTGKGDAFTITDMYWSSDRKVILTVFADGNSDVSRAFDIKIVKDGQIVGTYVASSVETASNGQLVYTVVGVGEGTEKDIKAADSLLFIGGKGEAVIIPNPVNDLEVKPFWEY